MLTKNFSFRIGLLFVGPEGGLFFPLGYYSK